MVYFFGTYLIKWSVHSQSETWIALVTTHYLISCSTSKTVSLPEAAQIMAFKLLPCTDLRFWLCICMIYTDASLSWKNQKEQRQVQQKTKSLIIQISAKQRTRYLFRRWSTTRNSSGCGGCASLTVQSVCYRQCICQWVRENRPTDSCQSCGRQ